MEESEIIFHYRARYFKIGEIGAHTRQIWFVLHGYGQLARYFIRKFTVLQEHAICVIAPEGLSRFYLEEVSSRAQTGNNRVGASWMTKENRLMDIDNYVHYLNEIYRKEIQHATIPITILGFSQGAATASRWASNSTIPFQRLVLWAGVFPPDMNMKPGQKNFKDKDVIFVYGKSDPFLTDSRLEEMKNLSENYAISPTVISFDGAHEIDEDTLLKLA